MYDNIMVLLQCIDNVNRYVHLLLKSNVIKWECAEVKLNLYKCRNLLLFLPIKFVNCYALAIWLVSYPINLAIK